MNRWQKIAWFNLIVVLTSLMISGTAVGVLAFIANLHILRALAGFGFIGLIGICGLSNLFFRKDKDKVQVSFDERDLLIQQKARTASYTAFWVLFCVAAVVPFLILGPKGVISVKVLPAMIFGGIVVLVLVESIVTLAEYGRGGKENE